MRIALDVMGTDYGPGELVLGAVMAVREYNCEVVLVGDEPTIRDLLKTYGADKDARLDVYKRQEAVSSNLAAPTKLKN